ncbi:MAG: ABC transporter ATP-binding protein [Coriobacteriales bacterium]|jgi:branched-chain amino acid transport system ATP-binding protein|nr:ABC transporter ATP-binding protein [Coriobacteriales bacterium]
MSQASDPKLSDPILSVKDLVVAYGSVRALHGISLEVYPGELVSVCGVNGSGKSTTLKTIAGILKPQSGQIIFSNKSIAGKKPEQIHKLGVALVPEGREIFPSLTVAENLRIGAFGRYSAKQFTLDLEDIYALFPILKQRINQAGGLLSGGEQQMLAIARALISHPELLMMDEPSLGLSPTMVDTIFELIATLKERKITILLVEQNAERALQIADRAYLLSTGHVKFAGQPADMQSTVDITAVYLGEGKGGEL